MARSSQSRVGTIPSGRAVGGRRRTSLAGGDLTGAHRFAKQAAELAPTEIRAREILVQAEAALAEQERQSRLAEELAKARGLIEISSWDESSAPAGPAGTGISKT